MAGDDFKTRSASGRRARCSCDGLILTCEGEPARISMCHCVECQKRTGSVFSVQAWFAEAGVRIERGDARSFVRVADSGSRVTFRFCSGCGSTVFWTAEGRPGLIAVAVGCFADPGFPTPRHSVWEQRRHAWVTIPPASERSD